MRLMTSPLGLFYMYVTCENIDAIALCLQGILAKLKDDQTAEVKALMAWVDFHNQDYAEATNK